MAQNRKFSITLFLLSTFIFLSIFLAMWIYGLYMDQASYANKISKDTIKCNSYSFELHKIHYENGKLSFEIENTLGDTFEKLVVEGEETKIINLLFFESGIVLPVNIQMNVSTMFLAYPEGCKNSFIKQYQI